MNRRMTITAAFVLMLGIWTAGAQTTFDRVNGVDPWSWGRNSAGMRTASPVRVSDAEVFGGFGSGGFKASHEASSLWKAGAGARTRVDLQRFSMTGAFSFVQEQGEGMCGSMFIHPGSYPVDVLEFTPGRKTLQTYSISGGIAVPLDDRWTLGGRFDFESGNYSKRKDIRHTNYRLDMTVAPSVTLSLDGWTIGVSAVFRKTSESIQAEQIGTATADSYFAFLDKGMIFGSYQVWNGSGIHLAEAGIDRFAVKELSGGAALQVSRSLGEGSFYAEAEYLSTSGEVGEKSYTFFKFPGAAVSAMLGYVRKADNGDNVFRVKYSWKAQENDEYVIEKVSSGGVVTPVIHGHNRIFDRRMMDLSPEWAFYGKGSASWLYKASVEAGWRQERQQSGLRYPYSFGYSTDIVSASASAVIRLGDFRLGAGVSCAKGFPSEDTIPEDYAGPYRHREYWDKALEWKNAARLGADLSLRYDIPFLPAKGLYAEASASFMEGFRIVSLEGSRRVSSLLKLGYEF